MNNGKGPSKEKDSQASTPNQIETAPLTKSRHAQHNSQPLQSSSATPRPISRSGSDQLRGASQAVGGAETTPARVFNSRTLSQLPTNYIAKAQAVLGCDNERCLRAFVDCDKKTKQLNETKALKLELDKKTSQLDEIKPMFQELAFKQQEHDREREEMIQGRLKWDQEREDLIQVHEETLQFFQERDHALENELKDQKQVMEEKLAKKTEENESLENNMRLLTLDNERLARRNDELEGIVMRHKAKQKNVGTQTDHPPSPPPAEDLPHELQLDEGIFLVVQDTQSPSCKNNGSLPVPDEAKTEPCSSSSSAEKRDHNGLAVAVQNFASKLLANEETNGINTDDEPPAKQPKLDVQQTVNKILGQGYSRLIASIHAHVNEKEREQTAADDEGNGGGLPQAKEAIAPVKHVPMKMPPTKRSTSFEEKEQPISVNCAPVPIVECVGVKRRPSGQTAISPTTTDSGFGRDLSFDEMLADLTPRKFSPTNFYEEDDKNDHQQPHSTLELSSASNAFPLDMDFEDDADDGGNEQEQQQLIINFVGQQQQRRSSPDGGEEEATLSPPPAHVWTQSPGTATANEDTGSSVGNATAATTTNEYEQQQQPWNDVGELLGGDGEALPLNAAAAFYDGGGNGDVAAAAMEETGNEGSSHSSSSSSTNGNGNIANGGRGGKQTGTFPTVAAAGQELETDEQQENQIQDDASSIDVLNQMILDNMYASVLHSMPALCHRYLTLRAVVERWWNDNADNLSEHLGHLGATDDDTVLCIKSQFMDMAEIFARNNGLNVLNAEVQQHQGQSPT